MIKGLGGGIIALILGIAIYKIVMAAQHAIDQGITAIVVAVSSAAGGAVALGAFLMIIEIRHRHQMYGTQNRAREAIITKLETGEIRATFDAVPQIDNILNPRRKPIAPIVKAKPMELEPVDVEEIRAIEAPSYEHHDEWNNTVSDLQDLWSMAYVERMRGITK